MTNGDKIRAMTDEELAIVLSGQCSCCEYQYAMCETEYCVCEHGVMEWLQKEVSEDAGTD